MRKIIVFAFLSMDGVIQAPGGPEEDPSNHFKWGGWMFPFSDSTTDETLGNILSAPFDLLLGRRTYEIFAAHWPYQGNNPIAEKFNRIQKFVVATTPPDLSWENSTLITGDVVSELKRLKEQDGPDLFVHGSSRLVQTLLRNKLIDVLHTWIFPLTLGTGKKLFEEGTQALEWQLSSVSSAKTGVIIASYVPGGDVRTGSFVPDKASEPELARRRKIQEGQW
jgi:dihydrofolate reductase